MTQPLFEGLVYDEDGNPVEVRRVGNEPCYVVYDAWGMAYHIPTAQVDRQVRGLRHHATLAVEQRAGEVEPLFDVGRERRAQQRGSHLLTERGEQVMEDQDRQSRALHRSSSGKSSTSKGT